jgi:hypothetical protein
VAAEDPKRQGRRPRVDPGPNLQPVTMLSLCFEFGQLEPVAGLERATS